MTSSPCLPPWIPLACTALPVCLPIAFKPGFT